MKLISAIKFDIAFQGRHGFYWAYLFVSIFYILLLRYVPYGIDGSVKESILVIIVFSDPSVLGFFFIGGIILLERGQGILDSLFVTPFKLEEYLISKVTSLTVIAILSSLLITFWGYGSAFHPIKLVMAISLNSFFFTLLGIAIAARMKSINGYLTLSPLYMITLFIPLLAYLGYSSSFYYLIPSQASLILIQWIFQEMPLWKLMYSFTYMIVLIIIAFYLAYRSLYNNIILKGRRASL